MTKSFRLKFLLGLTLAAGCTGATKATIRRMTTYAEERVQFGHPLADFEITQRKLAQLTSETYAADAMLGREESLPAPTQARINAALAQIDQLLLDPEGLPGRPWFKNLVYAPGTLTGYGAKTLPAVREAIEERRFADATHYIGITAKALDAYAAKLDQATQTLNGK